MNSLVGSKGVWNIKQVSLPCLKWWIVTWSCKLKRPFPPFSCFLSEYVTTLGGRGVKLNSVKKTNNKIHMKDIWMTLRIKAISVETWQSHAWTSHKGRRRETMPQSCFLTTACALCYAYTHIHTTTTIFQENASKTLKIEQSFNN